MERRDQGCTGSGLGERQGSQGALSDRARGLGKSHHLSEPQLSHPQNVSSNRVTPRVAPKTAVRPSKSLTGCRAHISTCTPGVVTVSRGWQFFSVFLFCLDDSVLSHGHQLRGVSVRVAALEEDEGVPPPAAQAAAAAVTLSSWRMNQALGCGSHPRSRPSRWRRRG